jgi:Na+-driven multidrug efflux pump
MSADKRTAAGGFPSRADSPRGILLFWMPLAAQWMMMSLEGPFLAAVIARTPGPEFNLAAYGVAWAFAILIESPVIMLMSAATALVEDAATYRKLRNFANALNVGATVIFLLVLIPSVHDLIMARLFGLPEPVVELVYGALWLLLPWPAAIGYRRFLHGVLIRSGQTRLVAVGTVVRITTLMLSTLLLFKVTDLAGAWVGAAGLTAGVVVEAAVSRWMASRAIRDLVQGAHAPASHPTPSYADVARFYYPLAVTSFLGLTVHPMLTFFMGRAPSPIASLAVFPVVHALSFLFRAIGFSFQEVVIALAGRRLEHVPRLARFGTGLAVLSSSALAVVAFTPLADLWFLRVSGLPPELAALAVAPAQLSVVLPALAVFIAFQHGILVRGRHTRPVTVATAVEVGTIAVLFVLLGWVAGLMGVTAAVAAMVGGRAAGNLFLMGSVRAVLHGRREHPTEAFLTSSDVPEGA